MEPEPHRLDREAMIADHLAVAERVRREEDEIVAAAVAKRRAHQDWCVGRMRIEARAQRDHDRIVARMHASLASRVASDPVAAAPAVGKSEIADPFPLARAVGEG